MLHFECVYVYMCSGGLAHVVEHSLSLREVPGSMPGSSKCCCFLFVFFDFLSSQVQFLQTYALFIPCTCVCIHVHVPACSGERVPAFERVLEVSADDADKLSSMMKYYKRVGYIRAHKRLYSLVRKYYHKDKVCIYNVTVASM